MRIGIRLAGSIARGALLLLGVIAIAPALAFADATPPRAGLDSPGSEAALRGVQSIAGWALDSESGIRSVRVWVNGVGVNYVSYPMVRKDGKPGFRLLWNTRFWPNGRHTIKIRVVNGVNLAADLEQTVRVANGVAPPEEPRPPLPFAGTWSSPGTAAPRPGDPHLGITVDAQNRLTLWTISPGPQSVYVSGQGVLRSDGSFDLMATEGPVRVTGRIADDRQSVQVTATPPGLVPFTVAGRGWPAYNPLSRRWAGTFTGALTAANGLQMRVDLSIDPSGNATCQAQAGWLRQSSICRVTPAGQLLLPGAGGRGDFPIGWLEEVNGAIRLWYGFWHPEQPYLFAVPLQPFPTAAPTAVPVDPPIRLLPKNGG